MKKEIIPAIIAKTQEELNQMIYKVKDSAQILQLDFMDGRFVPNHSIDFDFTLPDTKCTYEAHLMVLEPEKWIEKYWNLVDLILVHYESTDKHLEVIALARKKGKKVGLVINPETPVESIKPFLNKIDQVLVMTVNPGKYGSPFLAENLDKVAELRRLKPALDIEVDGGIVSGNIKLASEKGTNLFVSGSYIMKSENPKEAIENLKRLIA